MAWQTSEMLENGPSKTLVQQEKVKPFQHLSGKKVFAVAPMMDWTDQF